LISSELKGRGSPNDQRLFPELNDPNLQAPAPQISFTFEREAIHIQAPLSVLLKLINVEANLTQADPLTPYDALEGGVARRP
jgi:hypothetical protein